MKIFLRIFGILGIIIGAAMVFFSVAMVDDLVVTEYVYESSEVPEEFDGYRIVQMSDYHNHSLQYHNGYVVDILQSTNPDMVVVTGDMIDQYSQDYHINNLRTIFDGLKDYPVYYTPGNHEAYASHREEFFKMMYNYDNVDVLYDTGKSIANGSSHINIMGLHDPYYDNEDKLANNDDMNTLDPVLANLKKPFLDTDLNILLSHRPGMMEMYAKYNLDLVFSGHNHGGQIHPFGIYPKTDLSGKPTYQVGVFTKANTTMCVSAGMGSSGMLPVRYKSSTEIVVMTLKHS